MSSGVTKGICHLNGQDGIIEIFHTIYGAQKINTKLKLIDDDDRVGVIIGRQEIYLTTDEIKEMQVLEKSVFIVGEMMQIKISVE